MIRNASSDTAMPLREQISAMPRISRCSGTRLKSSLMHLESIVAGSLSGSVVASMKVTYSGGSSSVLSSALNAPVESMCTSSIIYTFFLPAAGGYLILSLSSRILSTPLFDAASISITSRNLPSLMAVHAGH